jgi:hypothetical protein
MWSNPIPYLLLHPKGVQARLVRIGLNGLAPLSLLFKSSAEPLTQNQQDHSSYFSIFIHFPENNDYIIVLLHLGNLKILRRRNAMKPNRHKYKKNVYICTRLTRVMSAAAKRI